MNIPDHLLVFTDMDGTLLGHDDYGYDATRPLITELKNAGAPVILSTSKTQPEVAVWQERLGLDDPVVVENGSAVVFPNGDVLTAGTEIAELEHFLEPWQDRVTSFVTCPLDQAVALTGLSPEEAVLARTRRYSIPFLLEGSFSGESLFDAARLANLRIVRGGRFLHLQGPCDKGMALSLVREKYHEKTGVRPQVIALGDNQNDESMLTGADVAVVIKSSNGYLANPAGTHVIYSSQQAPAGWVEGIQQALKILEYGPEGEQ